MLRLPTHRRTAGAAALGLSFAAFLLLASQAGRLLARQDSLEHADVIFVLAGTRVERPLEAADLYLAGYAPEIVLTRGAAESAAARVAIARGGHVPTDVDLTRELLRTLGVPDTAVHVADPLHDSTADEARTLRALATSRNWRRVIVVTSPYHLRRAGLAVRRALRGTDVRVMLRGSRHDPSTPDRWWTRRADIRWIVSETPKLVAYALGAGG